MTPITHVEGRRLALSNLEKVLYPATGTTKGEVLQYYARTATPLLAHLVGRPVSFLRYPDGPEGQVFFAKNVPPGTPDCPVSSTLRPPGYARSFTRRAPLISSISVPERPWSRSSAGSPGTGWSKS